MYPYTVATTVALLIGATAATQDIEVSGGEFTKTYTSPMKINLPIAQLAEKDTFITTELRQYVCEEVSIEHLSLNRFRERKGRDRLILTIRVYTRPPKDKWATIKIGIESDQGRISVSEKRSGKPRRERMYLRIDAEESKTRDGQVEYWVSREDLDQLLSQENPMLSIELNVFRN